MDPERELPSEATLRKGKTSGFTWSLDPGREALQKAGALDFKTATVRPCFLSRSLFFARSA